MEAVSIYIIFGLSAIGLVTSLIILWQYLTGRPYWGQYHNDIILLSVTSIIPIINVAIILLIVIGYSVSYALVKCWEIREKAVDKREKDEENSRRSN